jgi:hypothetical protein
MRSDPGTPIRMLSMSIATAASAKCLRQAGYAAS